MKGIFLEFCFKIISSQIFVKLVYKIIVIDSFVSVCLYFEKVRKKSKLLEIVLFKSFY